MSAQSLLAPVRCVAIAAIFLSSAAFTVNLLFTEAVARSATVAGAQEACMVACSDEHGRCIRWGSTSSACGNEMVRCVSQCRSG
jgi:hypothetical protein